MGSQPERLASIDEGRRAMDEPWHNGEVPKQVVLLRKATQCECGRTGLYLHLHIVDLRLCRSLSCWYAVRSFPGIRSMDAQ
jgi:hypothetical protein